MYSWLELLIHVSTEMAFKYTSQMDHDLMDEIVL